MWFKDPVIFTHLLFSLCCILSTQSHRHLLKGGRGGPAPSGVSGQGGSDGNADYDYTINIWIDYHWNIDNTRKPYIIEYSSLCEYIKQLIQQSRFDIDEITDQTDNKEDIAYTLTEAEELFESESTKTWHMKIDARSEKDAGQKLENYVKKGMAGDIIMKYNETGGLLIIVDVRCTIKEGTDLVVIIIAVIFGWIFGSVCLYCACGCVVIICERICCDGKDRNHIHNYNMQKCATPDEYVHDLEYVKQNDCDPFIDGEFSGNYKEYGKTYPMNNFQLNFIDGIVIGSGSDKVGDYDIKGIYSDDTQRMALDKTYIEGTGDCIENLGHTVKITLEFDIQKGEFKEKGM